MGLYKQIGYRNISLSSGDITNSLLKALNAENGLDLKALTARLSSSEQEALETNLIRGVIEKFTKDGITDFSKVSDTLKNAPFESKRAVEIMGELNKKAPILNNTSSLLEKLTAINPKAKELQQGIGHSVTGALMTMKRNLAIERLKSLLPVLGNDASLKNHIRNAINNAGDLKSVINNLEKIEIKDAPENSTKLLEAFKNEVKALREEAQNAEIKGDNFITKESPAPKSDLNVKISVDDWVRELGGINANKQIKADLTKLYEKHKELFAKPSDVFRLIKAVKENPTFFYNNNEPNTALIGKILDNGKLGKIGIQKDYDSEYLKLNHATYSSKADKENKRLLKRNEKSHLVGSPTPTQLTLGEATEPTADGAKALLDEKELTRTPALETSLNKEDGELLKLSNKSIIPQKDKEEQKVVQQASIKTNNNESIKTIVENLSRNREIALKLNPKADLLMAVKDFSKPIETPIFKAKVSIDKMLNHIIEKPNGDKRLSYLNLVKPTLENPLFITKEENRYRFVKTFIDDKEKVLKFLSVIENNKGEVLGITATPIKNTDIKNLIKGDIVWGGDTLSSLSTPQAVKRELDTDKDIIAQNSKDSVEKLLTAIDTSSDKVGLVKKVLLNKDISDGVKAKAVNRLTKNKISQGAKTSYTSTKNSDNN